MSVTLELLEAEILPAAFNRNEFKFLKCENSQTTDIDQLASSAVFLNAVVLKDAEEVILPILVKFEHPDLKLRKLINSNIHFHNEVLMYSEIIPLFTKYVSDYMFPKFYFGIGCVERPLNNVIVIEDLRPAGFRLSHERVFLDLEHLSVALEKLGVFHAMSYVAKARSSNEFYKMVGKLKEVTWIDGNKFIPNIVRACFHRAIGPLISAGRHVAVLRRLLARVDAACGVVRLTQELVAAEEPMAVLCHGDFCRNNLLFSYDADGATPVDVRFFDVATARYSSPAVDIAFFLLMNSSAAVRAAHYDTLLSRYHTTLTSAVTSLSGDVTVPSLQQIQQDMRRNAVYGFVHASFFLPQMMFKHSFPYPGANWVTKVPLDVVAHEHTLVGGSEGTEVLMNMVEELVNRGCLTLEHPFLQ